MSPDATGGAAVATQDLAAVGPSITISPTTKIMLTSPAPLQLTATVTGASSHVRWSLSYDLGSISPTGTYYPPPSWPSYNTVIAKATSVDDPSLSASVPINLAPYAAVSTTTPPPATTAAAPSITISPTTKIMLTSPAPLQLTATVTGAGPQVTWSLSYDLGSISQSGLYTPPTSWPTYNTVIATATSVDDPSLSASVPVNLAPYAAAAGSGSATSPPPTTTTTTTPPPTTTTTTTPPPTTTTTPPTTTNAAPPATGGQASRPSYNKGVGFFVLGGKLYDANGNEFRIRGVNKVHWDAWSPGLPASRANTVRWDIDFTRDANANLAVLMGGANQASGTVHDHIVVMPGNWTGTCSQDPSAVTSIVDTWVAQASVWTQPSFEKYSIINIANEWGPLDSTVWRDTYITAISRLRAAGYHATISVTSGGCGQDNDDLVQYGQAVFNSDPEKNVIFDQHIYGGYYDAAGGVPQVNTPSWDLTAAANALKATGLVVIFGEFGPGRNIGPSPTMVSPTRVIQIAEGAGLGWLAWAWDDNDLDGGLADDNWFAMSYSGTYTQSSDLTIFGRAAVEDPKWGLKVLATPASIF